MAAAGFRRLAAALALGLGAAACTSVNMTSRSLAGTWQVASVNGQAIPRDGDYYIQFSDRRISARFGCNAMGGVVSLTGDVLRIDGLTSTLMGCPEPAATIERNAATLLGQEMRVTETHKGVVRLDGATGSIELRR